MPSRRRLRTSPGLSRVQPRDHRRLLLVAPAGWTCIPEGGGKLRSREPTTGREPCENLLPPDSPLDPAAFHRQDGHVNEDEYGTLLQTLRLRARASGRLDLDGLLMNSRIRDTRDPREAVIGY